MLVLTKKDIIAGKECPNPANCAFCKLYWYYPKNCEGCPIKFFTGEVECVDTPYEAAATLYNNIQHGSTNVSVITFRKHVRAEIDFLKSLEIPQ
jgi:hypothetical protein